MARGDGRLTATRTGRELSRAAAAGRARLLAFRATPLGGRATRRRVVSVSVAGVVGLGVVHRLDAAGRTLDQWGPTGPVLVAAAPLGAGDPLDGPSVRVEEWPARLAPTGALTAPTARRTTRSVAAGAPLTADDLAGPADGPVVARMPDGTVGVTVARGAAPAPVRTGDLVDVLGAEAEGRSLGAPRVAARATVVAADRRSVTVAVRRAEAGDVAAAAAAGTAVLVLVP
ncbi:MAG: SAF domain-containing protein [Actinomycetes bacterium]